MIRKAMDLRNIENPWVIGAECPCLWDDKFSRIEASALIFIEASSREEAEEKLYELFNLTENDYIVRYDELSTEPSKHGMFRLYATFYFEDCYECDVDEYFDDLLKWDSGYPKFLARTDYKMYPHWDDDNPEENMGWWISDETRKEYEL